MYHPDGNRSHESCPPLPDVCQLLHNLVIDVPGKNDNIGWMLAMQPFLGHDGNPVAGQEFTLFGRVFVRDIGQKNKPGPISLWLMVSRKKVSWILVVSLMGADGRGTGGVRQGCTG